MSTEIWKFELRPKENAVKMPQHARPLSVGFQNGTMMMWAVVVPSNAQVTRNIYVTGTGWGCEHELRGPFLGTVMFPNGLVFHAFDHGENK